MGWGVGVGGAGDWFKCSQINLYWEGGAEVEEVGSYSCFSKPKTSSLVLLDSSSPSSSSKPRKNAGGSLMIDKESAKRASSSPSSSMQTSPGPDRTLAEDRRHVIVFSSSLGSW